MNVYESFADYYDAEVASYTDDLVFYQQFAQRCGSPLLELMCGSGRVLVPLAEAGYRITGVDSSPRMLEIARARVEEMGATDRVTLMQADVRTVDLPAAHFGLVFVAINSLMHLHSSKDHLAVLGTIRRALAPGGLAVIDLFNPDPMELAREDNRMVLEREYSLNGNRIYKFCSSESDSAEQTSTLTLFYDAVAPDGQTTRKVVCFALRWFYRYELEHLFARAGLRLRAFYGSYDLEYYSSSSPRLIAVATVE